MGGLGRAKLTEIQVKEIRQECVKNGISQEAMAKRYNVSMTTIKRIVSGKIWKHVGGPVASPQTTVGKLIPSEIWSIRLEHQMDGATLKTLAERYGVSVNTVWKIVHYKIYKTV